MSTRREFITLLGGAAAWPIASRAQQPSMPVIGFLNPTSPEVLTEPMRSFRQALKDAGYVEGASIAIEYRFADNQPERLPEMAAELVKRRVAVIVVTGGPTSALAAKAATAAIPIIFVVAEDPVSLGLVASLARPGGNLTGVNILAAELTAKRLELLRELVPGAARVAVFVNPNNPVADATVRELEAAARAMGLQIQALRTSSGREIDTAFATFARQRPDALFVAGDTYVRFARLCRSGRADELRSRPAGCLSPSRRIYRPRPQGRQACRPAGHAIEQVRAGHQQSDREGSRPDGAVDAARPRRRGGRIRVDSKSS